MSPASVQQPGATIRLEVPVRDGRYPVLVGAGLVDRLGPLLAEEGVGGRIALVADTRVFGLVGARARASLGAHRLLLVPEGEASKSLEQAARLWDWLAAERFSRGDCVLALGGGVVGDLAGFAAATFHRGMPFVQVPTTLLAQVDSSVGGKVAIDRPLGKNLVGAFHQPRLVVADVTLLASLDERQRWSGLAEVVKAGLIADPDFLAELEPLLEEVAEGRASSEAVARIVAGAVRIKAAVVAQDEREQGLRRILNFGHTVGHALETVTGYERLTHGEAVLLGMVGAVQVSARLSLLEAEAAARARRLLARFPVPPPEDVSVEEILTVMLRDKKVADGALHFVLIGPLGQATTRPADEALLREAIDAALAHWRGGIR